MKQITKEPMTIEEARALFETLEDYDPVLEERKHLQNLLFSVQNAFSQNDKKYLSNLKETTAHYLTVNKNKSKELNIEVENLPEYQSLKFWYENNLEHII